MTGYFLLLKYLEQQNNLKCMKTVASEMIVKCKNPQVPSHIWVKANLIYSKVLVKNSKPGKAILVLKCIAKLLPPIPFADIKYTKLLQRANSMQELTTAHIESLESMNAYNYSTYKNSFVFTTYNVREFSQKLIADEPAPIPETSDQMHYLRKTQRTITEKISSPRVYTKRRTVEIKDETETKEIMILGVSIPNLEQFRGFSICSDIMFLYKIAKISFNFNISLQDGLCAINDYIELLRFEKDIFYKEKQRNKAAKLKVALQDKIQDSLVNYS